MLSKADIKFINALTQKKYRKTHSLFIAEGVKIVNEIINSEFDFQTIYANHEWHLTNHDKLPNHIKKKCLEISDQELKKISILKTPNQVLALVKIPVNRFSAKQNLTLVLDAIRDPGNFGTIIRIADWYGVTQLVCSEDCVDAYNPKVIQATMGSISRVNIIYQNLESLVKTYSQINTYGAVLNGQNINEVIIKQPAFIFIGNESNGLSKNLESLLDYKLTIPKFGKAESLNAAVATGIIVNHFCNLKK